MNANELRIGNLVFYNDKKISISPSAINEFYYIGNSHSKSELDRIDYKQIVITEEILKNCNIKSELFKSNFSNDNDGYFLWIGGYKVYIKYLHKLQNLYFELEGTELEVNI